MRFWACGAARGRLLAVAVTCAALALSACGDASATATTTAAAATEYGKVLFRDKGCTTCHVNRRADGVTGVIPEGPDLSAYSNDPAYLRRWLADPPAVKPGARMPKLDLADDEITALIAFLNTPARP